MANENNSIVKSIRIGVPPPSSPASPAPPSNPRTRCNHSKECCSVSFLLQNCANFSRSVNPARFMRYQNDSWMDFSSEVLQKVQLAFLERKPMVQISIDGLEYIFDFLRMLEINVVAAKQRSIAWIDENGMCFFPKIFVSDEFEDLTEHS